MKLEKIFENDYFIIWKDNKGYDFVYDIENKYETPIIIRYGDFDEELEITDWVGLFTDDGYIIRSILNGNFEVKGAI